jgi:adenylate cyclase
MAAETARSRNRSTVDLTAYDLYLRAFTMHLASARQIPEALRLLEQAIARDPDYAPALALAAFCHGRLPVDGRSDAAGADRAKGIDFARRALELASDDPTVLVNVAHALAHFGEDLGAARALLDRAFVLNPHYARAWHVSGIHKIWGGDPDAAIEHTETCLRLSPRARVGPTIVTIAYAHFVCRRFEEAAPILLIAIQEDPTFPQPYRWLAACYAHMGKFDDARAAVERLRALPAVVVPDASFLRNAEHRALFLSGLRLAADAAT